MTMDEDTRNLVAALSASGRSRRSIAKQLGLARNTVRGILDEVEAARQHGRSVLPSPPVRRASLLDEHEAFIKGKLTEFPNLTAVRLHELLTEQGFKGGYTIVKEELRRLRPRSKKEPVIRFETEPGEQGQQDWSPYDLEFTEAPWQKMHGFSLVLGYCRRQYLHFCDDEKHPALIREHRDAFEHFQGVPREILYDGQKAVVLGWEAGRPVYNPRFLCFATHYGFRPVALPPRRPDLKGKVERPFDYVEKNLLGGRHFRTKEHLNEVAAWWMANRADVRTHGTVRERPIDRFVVEAEHLLPLPLHPYDTAEVGYRVVSIEAHVVWDVTPYSVPPEHVLEVVVVRVTEQEVFIYDSAIREIARHQRAPRGQREPVTNPDHRPVKKRRHDLEALGQRMGELGEAGALFAAGVLEQQRYRGSHLCQVLALVERYSRDDLVIALERAVRYRAFDGAVVERILSSSATPRLLPEAGVEAARSRLSTLLPGRAPRPLDTYEAALRAPSPSQEEP
jgi:transposase